jgi:hypothetical protein
MVPQCHNWSGFRPVRLASRAPLSLGYLYLPLERPITDRCHKSDDNHNQAVLQDTGNSPASCDPADITVRGDGETLAEGLPMGAFTRRQSCRMRPPMAPGQPGNGNGTEPTNKPRPALVMGANPSPQTGAWPAECGGAFRPCWILAGLGILSLARQVEGLVHG